MNHSKKNSLNNRTNTNTLSTWNGWFKSNVVLPHIESQLYRHTMKRFWLLLIPLTLIVFAAFYFTFSMLERVKLAELDSQTTAAIELARGHVSNDFETVHSDIKFLAASDIIRRFLKKYDLNSDRKEIERLFQNLANTHNIYDQVRLLSATGKELVRINYNQGSPQIVPFKQLQDKSDRYYFKEAAKISDNRIYVSQMDLNIENDRVELPHKPMVRFAQPVHDDSGSLVGVVVLNYLGSILIDRFRQQMDTLTGESMLLNNEGYWLSSKFHEQEWAFMFNKTENFSNKYPIVWQQVLKQESGVVETENGRFRFLIIHPLPPEVVANAPKSYSLEDWKIIVINRGQGIDTSYLFEFLSYVYPLLFAYPIGVIMLWLWAKASSGRKIAEFELQKLNRSLEEQVYERTTELQATKDITILSLATLAEVRDNETGQHIRRTQHYIKLLAIALKDHPDFHQQLDEDAIEQIFKSAPLHDIGKVGIPDNILLKPGKLTAIEYEVMKKHTIYGSDAIEEAINSLTATLGVAKSGTFLHYARNIAHYHHERWDGSGYPKGLIGDAIPLSARLMALVDVYDALVSQRVYKKAFSLEEAENIILHKSPGQFDPRIIEAFKNIKEQFWEVRKSFAEIDEYASV